jgi:flagellar motor switch protein FliG
MLALKSAPDELKEKFFNSMSERAKETLIEEMQFLGAVKMKDVETAQRRIVDVVNALAEAGTIALGTSSEEMVG